MNSRIRCIPAAIALILFSMAAAGAATGADEKREYENTLKTAAALQTKPAEYYEKIVEDLRSRGLLDGDIEKFEKAISGMFGQFQTEDYHLLSITLYSKGYGNEAEVIYHKYVESSKKLSPEEGLTKARDLLDKFDRARGRVAGNITEALAAKAPVAPVTPEKQWPQEKNIVFHRLTLTNGQVIEGRLAEKNTGGVWFETAPGAKVYFSKSEYRDITAIPTEPSK